MTIWSSMKENGETYWDNGLFNHYYGVTRPRGQIMIHEAFIIRLLALTEKKPPEKPRKRRSKKDDD